MDRVYLPGLDEDRLDEGQADDVVREQVARHVDRARLLFSSTLDVDAETSPPVPHRMRVARRRLPAGAGSGRGDGLRRPGPPGQPLALAGRLDRRLAPWCGRPCRPAAA